MAETIFWWIFTSASVVAFFLSYGMVEDLIRQWRKGREARKEGAAPQVLESSPGPKGKDHPDLLLH